MNNEKFIKEINVFNKLLSENYEESPIVSMLGFVALISIMSLDIYIIRLILGTGMRDILLMLIGLFMLFLGFLVAAFVAVVIIGRLNKKWNIHLKIFHYIYTGKLKDIFNFDFPETILILKKYETEIETSIIKNKGLSGDFILKLKEEIYPLTLKRNNLIKQRDNQAQQEEVKKALIDAETVSGQMLSEFDQLKNK